MNLLWGSLPRDVGPSGPAVAYSSFGTARPGGLCWEAEA
jgi:hypothetical protein